MKKKVLISVLVSVFSAAAFAGGWVQDFSSGLPEIYISDSESRASDKAWYVTGIEGLFSPQSPWKAETAWKNSDVTSGIAKPEGSFIYLDGQSGIFSDDAEFSLVSPAFTPAASDVLYYRFQAIRISSGESITAEEKIFVDIATKNEGVWLWTASTTNVLEDLTGENTEITVLSKSLSANAGSEIKIRFRGNIGKKDYAVVFYNAAVVDSTVSDLSVSTSIVSHVPRKHAKVELNASVLNWGAAFNGSAFVTASVVGADDESVGTVTVPALEVFDKKVLVFSTPTHFEPLAFGDYQLRYTLSSNANASNDTTVSNPFTVTVNTFATDDGTLDGATAVAATFGNKFTLVEPDSIESVSIAWGHGSNPVAGGTHDFHVVIYKLTDEDTTLVYKSEDVHTRPHHDLAPPHGEDGRHATFETYPVNHNLLAEGDYIFAIEAAAGHTGHVLHIGTETNAAGVYYRVDTVGNDTVVTAVPGSHLLVRVNTTSEIVVSPAVSSRRAGITEPIAIFGPAVEALTTDENLLAQITITAGDEEVENVAATFINIGHVDHSGNHPHHEIIISHAPFEYHTEYTVTVPAGVITGYDEELVWSFTTAGPLEPVHFLPNGDATDVALDAPVHVIFDRDIPWGGSHDGIRFEPTVTGISATVRRHELTIEHDSFARDTKYKVIIPNTVIHELAEDSISWEFTTLPPVAVSGTFPVDNATEVDLNTSIRVNFNQSIDTANSTLTGITINNDPATAAWTANGGKPNSQLNITKGADFTENTFYTVTIPAGAIADHSEAISWSFTTTFPIAVVNVFPENNATGVFLDAEIGVVFNKPVTKNGLNPPVATITTNGHHGTVTVGGVDYNTDGEGGGISNATVTITHPDLESNTTYTVTLPAYSVGAWSEAITWTFTTGSTTTAIPGISVTGGKVYPTITEGNITVVSEQGSLIKIVDLTGSVKATYEAADRQTEINLGNNKPGLYLVVIETGETVETHKVFLILNRLNK